jgi:proteasome lid subunit RPN8/RPN11
MNSKIIISEQPLQEMHEDARNRYPEECCGFMYGQDRNSRKVTEVISATNNSRENRKRRFEIDPPEYMKAEAYAEEQGLTLLGVYHSHPDHPAVPSEHDRKQAMPYFSYVIISLDDMVINRTTSSRLNGQRIFEEESLKVN